MAGLIGDKRKFGQHYTLLRTLLMNDKIGQLKGIIIKIQHNCRSDLVAYDSRYPRAYTRGPQRCSDRNPFLIPIKHDYCFVFQKV